MDHHDDAQFPAALGAEGTGKGGGTAETHMVLGQPADQAFDQSALARFEVTIEQVAATAFDSDDLSCAHV